MNKVEEIFENITKRAQEREQKLIDRATSEKPAFFTSRVSLRDIPISTLKEIISECNKHINFNTEVELYRCTLMLECEQIEENVYTIKGEYNCKI